MLKVNAFFFLRSVSNERLQKNGQDRDLRYYQHVYFAGFALICRVVFKDE